MPNHVQPHDHTIGKALANVMEAGQRVVVNRIELARLDALASMSQTLQTAVFISVGAVFISLAWFTLTAVVIILLDEVLPLPASLGAAAVINGGIGLVLVAAGARRSRAGSDEEQHGPSPRKAPRFVPPAAG